jgi:hypothetical protein
MLTEAPSNSTVLNTGLSKPALPVPWVAWRMAQGFEL